MNSPVPTSVRVRASLAVRWPLNGPHSLPPPPPSAQHAPFALFGRSQYMNDGYDDDDDDYVWKESKTDLAPDFRFSSKLF